MTLITEREVQKMLSEGYKHRTYLKDLKTYHLEKIYELISKNLRARENEIVSIINANPKYQYPAEVDESKLFEYWDERNDNAVRGLKKYKQDVQKEIYRRRNPSLKEVKEVDFNDKLEIIDKSINISDTDLRQFVETETNNKLSNLRTLLSDINNYSLESFMGDYLKNMTIKQREEIAKRMETDNIESIEEGWEIYLGVLAPFEHTGLIRLKAIIENNIEEVESKSRAFTESNKPTRDELLDTAASLRRNGMEVKPMYHEIRGWLIDDLKMTDDEIKSKYGFGINDPYGFNRTVSNNRPI
ncbi:MAG: hypothetical protein WEA58_04685 [Balneolaceae bacterium]